MKLYSDVILDRNGNVVVGATVTVLDYPSGATSTVYSSDAIGTTANPLTTDSDGKFSFYAKDGLYTLSIAKSGITSETDGPITIQDTAGWAGMGGYGITTSGDQAAALNAALVAMAASGPKVLKLTGSITVNSAITLQSGAQIDLNGWTITWGGSTTVMFTSATTGVLDRAGVYNGKIDCATASKALELYSSYQGNFRDLRIASNSSVNILIDLLVNTSGTTNDDANYNNAYNSFANLVQSGTCGTLLRLKGNSASQVVTLNTFHNTHAISVKVRGVDIAKWADSNCWTGVTRLTPSANNAVGVEMNSDTPGSDLGVYANNFQHLAVDTFTTLTGRVGLKMGFADQTKINFLFNDPPAEGGQYTVTANSGYDITYAPDGTNTLARVMDATTARREAAGSKVPYILAKSAVAVSCPADTSEDALATITVPAGALGTNGFFRVTANFSFTNSANTKDMRIRFSGAGGTILVAKQMTTELSLTLNAICSNANATGAQYAVGNFGHTAGYATLAPVTPAADTTAATTIVISGQKASSGETLTLKSYLVELFSDNA